jgi:hypothetical protein
MIAKHEFNGKSRGAWSRSPPSISDGGFISMIEDSTDQKDREAQFLPSRKMEAIGQLTGGVAHNKLFSVTPGSTELLRKIDPELAPMV